MNTQNRQPKLFVKPTHRNSNTYPSNSRIHPNIPAPTKITNPKTISPIIVSISVFLITILI
jgi:hypothetical protein